MKYIIRVKPKKGEDILLIASANNDKQLVKSVSKYLDEVKELVKGFEYESVEDSDFY